MAKYNGLTVKDVCRLEVKEARGILKKYGVSKWDREIITGMIREAYFQLQESYKMSRIFEEYVMEKISDFIMRRHILNCYEYTNYQLLQRIKKIKKQLRVLIYLKYSSIKYL